MDPEAFDSYLRARFLLDQRTAPAIRRAIGYFEKSLGRDPRYALAWAGLATCYATLPITSDARPRDCFPNTVETVRRALALDISLPEAHIASGIAHFWFDWNWAAAEREFQRARELNPSDSRALMFLAHLYSNLSRHGEALKGIQAAGRLDPLSLIINTHQGQFLYHARRYAEAQRPLERILEVAPRFWIARVIHGLILGVRGRLREALREFSAGYRYSYGNTFAPALRGYTLGALGNSAAARTLLRELDRRARRTYVPPVHPSLVRLGLSEPAAALDDLEKAVEERDVRLVFLAVEPRWDPLRTHPQFEKLSKRIGFPTAPAGNRRPSHQ